MVPVYMKVTSDRYRLPVAVADSIGELAHLCGVTYSTISKSLARTRNHGTESKYIRVLLPDDPTESKEGT